MKSGGACVWVGEGEGGALLAGSRCGRHVYLPGLCVKCAAAERLQSPYRPLVLTTSTHPKHVFFFFCTLAHGCTMPPCALVAVAALSNVGQE